jgi:hypothetical protein
MNSEIIVWIGFDSHHLCRPENIYSLEQALSSLFIQHWSGRYYPAFAFKMLQKRYNSTGFRSEIEKIVRQEGIKPILGLTSGNSS